MKRKARLPRHAKSLLPSLRMPKPLCTCGWPKVSASSHNASRHSTLSLLGSSCNRRSTAGSMERSLFKQLSQLRCRNGDQFSRPLELPVAFVRGLLQSGHLFRRHSVFALRIVRGFHLHLAQRDNVCPADNTDVFPLSRRNEPLTQIFFCLRDG